MDQSNTIEINFSQNEILYQNKMKMFSVKLSSLNQNNIWSPTTKIPPITIIILQTKNKQIITFVFDHTRYFKPLDKITGWMYVSDDGHSYRLFVDKN